MMDYIEFKNLSKDRFLNDKIKVARIAVNGLCNAGCWYCPVKYESRDFDNENMTIENLEKIIQQILSSRGDYVDENFSYIWPEHYNEIFLYPYFVEMLDLFRKYGLRMIVLSNAIALTPEKADILLEYSDVCGPIILNVPSLKEETWAKYTNKPKSMFKKVLSNLKYIDDNISMHIWTTIQVNGLDNASINDESWHISLKDGTNDFIQNDITEEQVLFEKTFRNTEIFIQKKLTARGGNLSENDLFSHPSQNKKVVGCAATVGGMNMLYDILSINTVGDAYLCCEDYSTKKTKYGNVFEESIKTLWTDGRRMVSANNAHNDLCKTCPYAILEK